MLKEKSNSESMGSKDSIIASENLFEELYVLLERLVKIYRLLLDTVRKENELLVAVDVSELEENNKIKEATLKKLRQVENERIRVVRLLAKEKGLKEEPIKLLDLAGKFSIVEGDKLRQKHTVLELLIKRVIDNNKKNEVLAQSALENVSGAMNVIKESLNDKSVYEKKGVVANNARTAGRLIRREV